MSADRCERLSDRQRQCLRLVQANYRSKEIAPLIGRSPHTVDQWIREALQVLGVGSRLEAARLLAKYEEGNSDQRLISQRLRMVGDDSETQTLHPSEERRDQSADQFAVREPTVGWGAYGGSDPRPAPPLGERTGNGLNWWQRLMAIAVIAIGALLAFGALLAGLDALSKLI